MMVIPEDLPRELAPLGWMLGTWKGWGMLSVPDGEDIPVVEDVTADICGTQMRLMTSISEGMSTEPLDPELDAPEGLARLIPGDLLRQDTWYVRVLPGSGGPLPPPGEYEPRELMATSADMDGIATLWAGRSVGPRVQFISDQVARDSMAQDIRGASRMYGLVGGEMFWAQELVRGDADEQSTDLSGRLMRMDPMPDLGGEASGD